MGSFPRQMQYGGKLTVARVLCREDSHPVLPVVAGMQGGWANACGLPAPHHRHGNGTLQRFQSTRTFRRHLNSVSQSLGISHQSQ